MELFAILKNGFLFKSFHDERFHLKVFKHNMTEQILIIKFVVHSQKKLGNLRKSATC